MRISLIKQMVVVLTLAMLSVLYGCKNEEKETNIKQIDSLLTVKSDLLNQIETIDFDSVNLYYSLIMKDNEILKRKLFGLPSSEKMKKNLIDYGTIEKGFKKIPKRMQEFKKELEISEKQLNDLKSDVENDLLEAEDFQTYFNEEKAVLDRISGEINNILKVLNDQIRNFHELKPVIALFTDSLMKTEDKF